MSLGLSVNEHHGISDPLAKLTRNEAKEPQSKEMPHLADEKIDFSVLVTS